MAEAKDGGYAPRFAMSPVDYAAWNKGYSPPSDHILIDALHFRGARVVMSFDHGKNGAVWLVLRDGKWPKGEVVKQLMEILHELVPFVDESPGETMPDDPVPPSSPQHQEGK